MRTLSDTGLTLCLVVCLLMALPTRIAGQYCQFGMAAYTDMYDDGISESVIYGAGYDFSQCPFCYHSGYALGLDASGPDGVNSGDYEGGYGVLPLTVMHDGTVTWNGHFLLFCNCANETFTVDADQGSRQVQRPYISGPTSLQRGQIGTFTIENLPAGASISGWQYQTASNGTVTRQTDTASAQWSGIMVNSGSLSASVNGVTIPPLSVVVTPRTGWAWTAPPSIQRSSGYVTNCGTLSVPTTPLRTGIGNTAVGQGCGWPDFDPAELVFTLIPVGPNTGLRYLATPLSSSSATRPSTFDWAMSPDVDNLSSDFMIHQTGSYLLFPQGCIFRETLRSNLRLHEGGAGATAMNQSHYTMFKDQFENVQNLGVIAEQAIGGLQQTEAQAKAATQSALIVAINAMTAVLHGFEPPADWNQNPVTLAPQGAVNYPNPFDQDCIP